MANSELNVANSELKRVNLGLTRTNSELKRTNSKLIRDNFACHSPSLTEFQCGSIKENLKNLAWHYI